MSWDWLEKKTYSWVFVGRVIAKALVLFVLINLLYVLLQPLPAIGRVSVYGGTIPYRERLPFGERKEANNLSLNSLEAMFATHEVQREKASDEYRVFLIGDSATWGILLENNETTSGVLNQLGLVRADGKRVVAYNIGYPTMSVLKDLMLLEYAMRYNPDAVVWLVTLESLPRSQQLTTPLVRNNLVRVNHLITTYGIELPTSPIEQNLLDQTLIGQRRALADWLRLQLFGVAWATTGVDQYIGEYVLRSNDFEEDIGWYEYEDAQELGIEDLALDVVKAGRRLLGDVPLLIINEPIFIADGENSDLRYNFWYPRWAYDSYLAFMERLVPIEGWSYLNVWDSVPAFEFTDSPVHMTVRGSRILAERIGEWLVD